MIHGKPTPGSLRAAAPKMYGTPVLVYEGGEDQRFDEASIVVGAAGVGRVMEELGIVPSMSPGEYPSTLEVRQRAWIRCRRGGILRLHVGLGEYVAPRQEIGVITDAFGQSNVAVRAPGHGIVIGRNNNPVVNRGDPAVHLGRVEPM